MKLKTLAFLYVLSTVLYAFGCLIRIAESVDMKLLLTLIGLFATLIANALGSILLSYLLAVKKRILALLTVLVFFAFNTLSGLAWVTYDVSTIFRSASPMIDPTREISLVTIVHVLIALIYAPQKIRYRFYALGTLLYFFIVSLPHYNNAAFYVFVLMQWLITGKVPYLG